MKFQSRAQARGRLGRNTRPDGVNFALEGSGGENKLRLQSPVAFVKVATCIGNILKTKCKYLLQTDMKLSDNLAKYIQKMF